MQEVVMPLPWPNARITAGLVNQTQESRTVTALAEYSRDNQSLSTPVSFLGFHEGIVCSITRISGEIES